MASDQGCVPLPVLLKLSATFNTNAYNIPLDRLEKVVGVKETALFWLRAHID